MDLQLFQKQKLVGMSQTTISKVYVYLKSGKSYLVDRFTTAQAALDKINAIEVERNNWK